MIIPPKNKPTAFYPFKKAVLLIMAWTFLISGSGASLMYWWTHNKKLKSQDERYQIVALVQANYGKESVKTACLAEWLGLSYDDPQNLYAFNCRDAESKLAKLPVIQWVKIKKILPGTVYVEYQLRQPVALLGNLSNTAIDEEGMLFPLHPFYTPKNLPKLYLGLPHHELVWGHLVPREMLGLAFNLLARLPGVRSIDLSRSEAFSYGQRQIIAEFNGKWLRLNTEAWKEGLDLLNQLPDTSAGIIDLRIPRLAFIGER